MKSIKKKGKTGSFRALLAMIVILGSLAVLSSCRKEGETIVDSEIFVGANQIGTYTAQELQSLLRISGFDFPSWIIKYNVDVYIVTYLTNYKGSKVTASGVVVIPKTTDGLSMISFHHGTIVAQKDAPSAQTLLSNQIILFSILSSAGFILVIPDYLGFGNTSSILHPYYVEEYAASAVIDNLSAVRELTTLINVRFNRNLFLAGYSEGGYVTMAVHKYLDRNGLGGFNLIASFPAAGWYDIKEMQKYIFGQQVYSDPYNIAYLCFAYKTTFGWTQPLNEIFNEPYADRIPGLFNGALSGSQINVQLTDTIHALLKGELLANIDTDPKYKYITDSRLENSLTDWTPKTPIYMFQGDEDIVVPYQNSEAAFQKLQSNSASPEILHFISLPGTDHSSGIMPYLKDVIQRIRILDMNANH